MQKMERLLGIVLALNKNKKMTAVELAQKFEVDVRTIYRDIQALSELNVPIAARCGPEGGYTILNEYFVPSIVFNKEEIFSLLISQKLIGKIRIPGYTNYINSAFLKINNVTSPEQMKKLDRIENRILFDSFKKHIHSDDFKYFDVIIKGIEENRKIKITRGSENYSEMIENIIEPYGLIYLDEVWQLIFNCQEDEGLHDIPINWIYDVELLNETFKLMDEFDVDQYYCDNFCVLPCESKLNERPETIKLKINKDGYYRVKDYIFFHDKHIIDKKEDYFIIVLKLIEPSYYLQIALKFSDIIEILEPRWLRKTIFEEIEKLYNKYKNY